MTIDYTPLINEEVKSTEFSKNLSVDDIRHETNRLYDIIRALLDDTVDADIVFVPYDAEANDPYAEKEEDQHIGWTLGHLVAHVTASAEEGAIFSAILAGGVPQGGRIRYETPWEAIDTVEKAIQRLEESRRMILAYLSAWPDEPQLDVLRQFSNERVQEYFGPLNAKGAVIHGLYHLHGHLDQFNDVLQQAKSAINA